MTLITSHSFKGDIWGYTPPFYWEMVHFWLGILMIVDVLLFIMVMHRMLHVGSVVKWWHILVDGALGLGVGGCNWCHGDRCEIVLGAMVLMNLFVVSLIKNSINVLIQEENKIMNNFNNKKIRVEHKIMYKNQCQLALVSWPPSLPNALMWNKGSRWEI